jgi:hypothetical protein
VNPWAVYNERGVMRSKSLIEDNQVFRSILVQLGLWTAMWKLLPKKQASLEIGGATDEFFISGNSILLDSRILAVSDITNAIMSHRS